MDPVEPNADPILVQGVNGLGTDIARAPDDGRTPPACSIASDHDASDAGPRLPALTTGAVRILTETASAGPRHADHRAGADSLAPRLFGVDPRGTSWSFVTLWRRAAERWIG